MQCLGHFAKAKTTPKRKIVEFQRFSMKLILEILLLLINFKKVNLLMLLVLPKVKVFKVLLKDTVLVELVKQLTVNTTE
jgi:hypothetical protein